MKTTLAAALVLSLVVVGCGDNDGVGSPDARGSADARPIDAPPIDSPEIDAPDIDAPPNLTNIAAALATPNGTSLSLPISGTVTYLKPAIGADPVGFTVQEVKTGPAIFVAVDPATALAGGPLAVGDVVTFKITAMATTGTNSSGMSRYAAAITDVARTSQGASIDALVTNITAATDVVAMVAAYDGKLVTVTGVAANAFVSSGAGFQRTNITTTGVTTLDNNFQLRIPTTIIDAKDLVATCTITATKVPVLRFAAQAEVVAYRDADLTVTGCPAPVLLTGVALSPTSVKLSLSRHVDPATLTLADITFDNGLTASAFVLDGRDITVTTSAQTAGTTYTATIAATITDQQGTLIGATRTAAFPGFVAPATVKINEVNANITGGCDLIELRVTAGGALTGFKIQERTGGTDLAYVFPSLLVATNDFIVVHINSSSATCNPNAATSETTKNGQLAATYAGNYDTAFDFWAADTGLTNTDNVFTLYDATGAIHDALFASDDPAGATAAAGTETQAAAVGAASQWSPVLAAYVDTVFRTNAADDLNATGVAASGTSIQRTGNSDTNAKTDWTTGAGAASTFGALNVGQTAL